MYYFAKTVIISKYTMHVQKVKKDEIARKTQPRKQGQTYTKSPYRTGGGNTVGRA
jgi:hypothetical protein